MAGFLDAKERVIDLVLTDQGKQLMLKGQLVFAYWVPFDDEVNYQPPAFVVENSSSYSVDDLAAAISQKRKNLIEDPLIREASSGYRGLNVSDEDMTNVIRPMYTAAPGVGHTHPLPQLLSTYTDSPSPLPVVVKQTHVFKNIAKKDASGKILESRFIDMGFKREVSTSSSVGVSYLQNSFSPEDALEGVLVTTFQRVSGSFQEVIHNRTSEGEIAFRNDLKLTIEPK